MELIKLELSTCRHDIDLTKTKIIKKKTQELIRINQTKIIN